jgi:SEC-C motif-containing protein
MARKSKPVTEPLPEPTAAVASVCPCCSGKAYAECCGPLHSGAGRATSAEQLMRSRFSAFAVGDAAYLLRSWHPGTRPARLSLDAGTRWTRLEILGTADGGPFHSAGTVDFRAYYRERGGAEQSMRENSTFAREDGAWVYVSAL